MKSRHVLILSLLVVFQSFSVASPEFADPWEGQDHEIEKQALAPLTSHAKVQIQRRFLSPDGELSLERKLWVLVDFLVDDEGRNYRDYYYQSLFQTISAEDIATEYTVSKTKALVEALLALPQGPAVVAVERKVYVGHPLTGEPILSSPEEIARERRLRFTCDFLTGCFNVLLKYDKEAGLVLAEQAAESEYDDIALTGRAFVMIANEPVDGGGGKVE
ncbi:MAG: hypothetical protein CMO55_12105 [Verrucomicrobiales bacterium]|nr:hypothetical protein [Verrucomicrobiales bacterium]